MLTTEDKLSLCGINIKHFNTIVDISFSYKQFEALTLYYSDKLPQIIEYKLSLWKFGICLYSDKIEFEKNQYQTFQYAIDLLEKAKFLIDNQNSKIKISNTYHIIQSIFFDDPKYINAILDEIKKEIEELNINCFIPTNEITDIVDKLSLEEQEELKAQNTFSLEQRDLVEKKIEQLKYWKEKDGEDKRRKPVKEVVHMGIHPLAWLLRIDEFFVNRKNCNTIDDIKLSNTMCKFIFAFLNFFKIYNTQDFVESSEPYLNIRNLYRKPPKEAAPLLFQEIMKIKNLLDTFIKKR